MRAENDVRATLLQALGGLLALGRRSMVVGDAVSLLERVDLREADLEGLDLTRVVLRHSTLAGARLAGATLVEADLRGTDLSGLAPTPEQLTKIFVDRPLAFPPGSE